MKMEKWADYLISGIWISENPNSHVSHVFLHEDTDDGFSQGEKTSKEYVVKLLKAKKTVKTMEWDYKKAGWVKGADVGHLKINDVSYLRTHKDNKVIDNLLNLIRMDHFSF
ncbi:hypothetical protein ACVW0P_000683 [Mucilaginibacter sp. UYNi724]